VVPGARLIVLGKQGAGKGTQCVTLSHHYVIPHISTGDMLRGHLRAGTPLGLEAKSYMDQGELVPDDVVLRMVGERLDQDDTRFRGFVFDGFPRTVVQAEQFEKLLLPLEIDCVINLSVRTDVVIKRLASRRVCEDCGTNYSLSSPPRVDWMCDVCGGEVVQRPDDTEAAIQRRLDLYEAQTKPLVARYRGQHKLIEVSGAGTPTAVSDRLIKALDHFLRRRGPGSPPPHLTPDPATQ